MMYHGYAMLSAAKQDTSKQVGYGMILIHAHGVLSIEGDW